MRLERDPVLFVGLISRSSKKTTLESLLLEQLHTASSLVERVQLTNRIKQLIRRCGPCSSIPGELQKEAYRSPFLSSCIPGAATWGPALAAPPRHLCGVRSWSHASIPECLCRSIPEETAG